MKALVTTATQRTERVFLIGVEMKSKTELKNRKGGLPIEETLNELAQLVDTAGGVEVGRGVQRLETPVASTYIGTGKAGEMAEQCRELKVDTVIFDDDLSPAQERNLERIFQCKILDRTALILDIFALRARTREGKMQVELALLQHLLPRLTRYWGHLSRQKGGIGLRGGEGETQLETDRRKVQERIEKITEELKAVEKQRHTQRQGRKRNLWPLASIVGYTNAGKSTLFNALTGAEVLAEDKLFATLDPTTRRLHLETNQNVLLSDTVGFIRKLPHGLVAAFKATLEEVVQADLLLHVVDVSHPHAEEQTAAANAVLDEMGVSGKPMLMVLNKIDQVDHPGRIEMFLQQYPHSVGVSAKTGEGFGALRAELSKVLKPIRLLVDLAIPHEAAPVIARLHELSQVVERNFDGPQAHFKARIPPHYLYEFERYIIQA
jgi:GTP-binding protein HflX